MPRAATAAAPNPPSGPPPPGAPGDRRMLHVIRSLDPAAGGPAELLAQLAQAQPAAGVTPAFVTLDPPGARWLAEFPGPTVALGPGAGVYGWSPRLRPWLRTARDRYDAVIVHGLWLYHGLAVARELGRSTTPYFVFPHGMLDRTFRDLSPAKHLKKKLYWLLVERSVLARARAVLFTCAAEERMAAGTFGPTRYASRIVPLGVPEPPADPDALRAAFFRQFPHLQNTGFLLFLGRLHPKKGCDLLVEALARTAAARPLVMAGPTGDERFVGRLKERAAAAGLPVLFPGMLLGDLKWGALAAADAFILPSHQENFGLAVAEALAVGCPVLISDKVNTCHDIAADRAGLVEPDDEAGTTRLLERWRREREPGFRTRARACFERRFHIRQTAAALAALR